MVADPALTKLPRLSGKPCELEVAWRILSSCACFQVAQSATDDISCQLQIGRLKCSSRQVVPVGTFVFFCLFLFPSIQRSGRNSFSWSGRFQWEDCGWKKKRKSAKPQWYFLVHVVGTGPRYTRIHPAVDEDASCRPGLCMPFVVRWYVLCVNWL